MEANKSLKRMEARSLVEALLRTDHPFLHRAVSFNKQAEVVSAEVDDES